MLLGMLYIVEKWQKVFIVNFFILLYHFIYHGGHKMEEKNEKNFNSKTWFWLIITIVSIVIFITVSTNSENSTKQSSTTQKMVLIK